MIEPNYRITIWFHEEGTEAHVGEASHEHPPAVGDIVYLDSGTWEVVKRAWQYPSPTSVSGMRGDHGGILECLVREAQGPYAADEADQ